MDKILELAAEGDESAIEIEELVFEEVVDEERSIIRDEDSQSRQYDRLKESDVHEVRLKEDLHTLLVSAVCQLKERI